MSENVIIVNGKTCDLTGLGKIKMKDWRELANMGIDVRNMEDIRVQMPFAVFMLNKVNPEISIDDIDELELAEFAEVSKAIARVTSIQKEEEGPLEVGPKS